MRSRNKRQALMAVKPTTPLRMWLRDFLLDVRAANRTESTIGYYKQKIEAFLNYLEGQGITEPAELTAPVIRAYLLELGETHTSGGVHAYWRAIRAYVRFMVREDAIDRNPLDKMRAPKLEQDLLEPVSEETVMALLTTCDKSVIGKRDRAIILTLLDTGLRAGEITALDIGDVDLGDGSVAVRKSKSRESRYTFVGRQARKAIAAYLRTRPEDGPNQPLWLAYHRDGEQPVFSTRVYVILCAAGQNRPMWKPLPCTASGVALPSPCCATALTSSP